jgi:predicted nucleic acid-binding protein
LVPLYLSTAHRIRWRRASCEALAAGRQPRIHDTWIAATPLVNGAELWTQNADFSDFDGTAPVIRDW